MVKWLTVDAGSADRSGHLFLTPDPDVMASDRPSKTSIGLITLGCPKNTVDSETMLRSVMGDDRVEVAADAEHAEIVVINTCGFIDTAKEESIDAILEAVEGKKQGRHRGVVVAGCLAERYRAELEDDIPGYLGALTAYDDITLADLQRVYTTYLQAMNLVTVVVD